MNRAQAIIPLGHGCYTWRDDVSPGPWVLVRVLENRTPPKAMPTTTHVCQGPPPGKDLIRSESRERHEPMPNRVLRVLRVSWRSKNKMCAREICEKLGVSRSTKWVDKVLRRLCDKGLVRREGTKKQMRYWAE